MALLQFCLQPGIPRFKIATNADGTSMTSANNVQIAALHKVAQF
jgi:hypothetical protein